MSITFQRGATTVTLPDPVHESPVEVLRLEATGLTAGGTRYTYSKGVELYRATLTVASVSESDLADFIDFYQDEAEGSANTFTYTTSSGRQYSDSARFAGPPKVTKNTYNDYGITVTLELSELPR